MAGLNNAELDLIFEPRGTSTKRSNVNLQTLGVDISNRYYSVTEGGTATAANTNLQSAGADISTLFAEIGTVSTVPNAALPADFTVSAFRFISGQTATATVILETDGDISRQINLGSVVDNGDVTDDNASFVAADWEVRAVYVSGSTPNLGNGLNTYYSMDTERSWTQQQVGDGFRTGDIDITVREKANTANSDTVRVTLTVEVNPN